MLLATAALRDPEAHPDPEAVDFDRDAPTQLVFGGGAHYCLGAHLAAKTELRIGLETPHDRFSGLRLDAEPDRILFSGGDLLIIWSICLWLGDGFCRSLTAGGGSLQAAQ